jgi:drug/metabolite transporter (DMT)-like permease
VAAAAPALFVVLWSTGFVVARYGTRDAAPLTFLSIRLAIAACVLGAVAVATRAPRLTRPAAGWAAVAGLGMHAVYLGGVFVAIDHGLPSGIGALIAGLHPVITSLAARGLLGERLVRAQWAGIALGFAGVTAVVIDRLAAGASGLTTGPLLASALSVLGMSGGTLVQRRHGSSMPLLWGSVVQYLASAAVLAVGAGAVERFDIRWTAQSLFAMAWAVVVLSIAAVLLMLWLLQQHAASRVSSLFFLTPALSALEGAILFGERLGLLALAGLAIALVGVALVTRRQV